MHLGTIFHTLNTAKDQRLKNLDESLAAFPYVNGKLFEEILPPAAFDSQMRDMLLEACGLDWGSISPAIFGSMFQAVMNPKERRNLGAHYTSEKNIQKVIKPLFLDDLYKEFERAKGNRNRLNELHLKIAGLRFLDPACGCGNFLIISYRELRELEILILRELNKSGQGFLDVREIIRVDVDQFAGIEIDEFAVRIAETAMWLIDHQMNQRVSDEFGQYFVRLPLTKAAKIVHGNALRLDWSEVVPKEQLNYILGNPPFIGTSYQSTEQKADMQNVFRGVKSFGTLDYVSAWYIKAAQYIQNSKIQCAFVSTNSIAQGEQVGILWGELFSQYHIKIHFAHRTFSWSNEARGKAAVHVVIIGFGAFNLENKRIFDYSNIKSEPQERKVKNINPYLVSGNDMFVLTRKKPLSDVPEMFKGSQPTDGGNLLLDNEEKIQLLKIEPQADKFIHPFMGSNEFINGIKRWCIWLVDVSPNELKAMPQILNRVENVKLMRLKSKKTATVKWARFPTLFTEIRQPNSDFLALPEVSSERRKYIPIGYLTKEVIVSNKIQTIPNANLYLFGILTSEMHMAWMRYVCGRLKSDYNYSSSIVYNNYPFPENPTNAQKQKVEAAAQAVLDARANYPGSSLADLYDPVTMPPDLVKAHQALDKAVDLCYRPQAFTSELGRIEFLFGLYEQYTAPMFGGEGKKGKKKNREG
ncbi:MAG: class I SAM-dependent DNA methyltransferase [Saprospiraceae bacterium]|nr:class I SAM-dependent DNA methyltransferase [Saprospiraceae bacterium]